VARLMLVLLTHKSERRFRASCPSSGQQQDDGRPLGTDCTRPTACTVRHRLHIHANIRELTDTVTVLVWLFRSACVGRKVSRRHSCLLTSGVAPACICMGPIPRACRWSTPSILVQHQGLGVGRHERKKEQHDGGVDLLIESLEQWRLQKIDTGYSL
jgi:hypothetical protein